MIVEENFKITTVVFNRKLHISKITNDINADLIPNPLRFKTFCLKIINVFMKK